MLLNEEHSAMKIYVNFKGPVPRPLRQDLAFYIQDIANYIFLHASTMFLITRFREHSVYSKFTRHYD